MPVSRTVHQSKRILADFLVSPPYVSLRLCVDWRRVSRMSHGHGSVGNNANICIITSQQ